MPDTVRGVASVALFALVAACSGGGEGDASGAKAATAKVAARAAPPPGSAASAQRPAGTPPGVSDEVLYTAEPVDF